VGGACSRHREIGAIYIILIGNPEGKRPNGRPKRRWKDVIMNLKVIWHEVWI